MQGSHGCIGELIRRSGVRGVGVSICDPATSVDVLRDILPLVDVVLVMSVEPGFGGQSFIPASLDKIARLRALAQELGLETVIEVDGGISSAQCRARCSSRGEGARGEQYRLRRRGPCGENRRSLRDGGPSGRVGPASLRRYLPDDFRAAKGGLIKDRYLCAVFIPIMISLDNLTVNCRGWTLFDNISFLINPKDRIGLVGKNSAGKTTLLRIITGEQPTSGAVAINECTIGYLPQTMRVADTTTPWSRKRPRPSTRCCTSRPRLPRSRVEIAERTDYESAAYEQLLNRLNDAQDRFHILGGETRDADIEDAARRPGIPPRGFRPGDERVLGRLAQLRIELAKLLLRRA